MSCKKIQNVIESILEANSKLEHFRAPQTESFWLKVGVGEGFMPLSIERHGSRVVVAHYFSQNGDLIPDPDMEFEVLKNGEWRPTAIQHSTGLYVVANERTTPDLVRFSEFWARNLKAQGFIKGKVLKSEIR